MSAPAALATGAVVRSVIVREAARPDFPDLGSILWEAFSGKLRLFVPCGKEQGGRLLRDLFASGGFVAAAARVAADPLSGRPLGVCMLRIPGQRCASLGKTFSVALRHFGPWRGIQAFAGLCLFDERARPDAGLVALLAVAPEIRGQGVGTALLRAVEKEARERGLSLLALDVIEGNPARNLYERCGFRTTRRHYLPPLLSRLFGFASFDHMEKKVVR